MATAIEMVRKSLETSDQIERTGGGYVVWDDYGMVLASELESLSAAVDVLFTEYYAA